VLLPGIGGDGGSAKVSANLASGGRRCEIESFESSGPDEIVEVRCVNGEGTPIDSDFRLTYMRDTGITPIAGRGWAYVLANEPTNPVYSPSADHQASSTGSPSTVFRTGVGSYTVALSGLGTPGGHAQVSSFGDVSRFCTVTLWQQLDANEEIRVRCFEVGGAAADAQFTLSFLE
jgi:hypothetical protein